MKRRVARRNSVELGAVKLPQAVKEIHAVVREIRLRRERERISLKRSNAKAIAPSIRRLRQKYLGILEKGESRDVTRHSLGKRIKELRRLVITEGLPNDAGSEGNKRCSLRGLVWKILLGAVHMDTSLYIRLVEMGPSDQDKLIQNDLFRVFPNDENFVSSVSLSQMSRILNALFHLNQTTESNLVGGGNIKRGKKGGSPSQGELQSYHQVMSVVAGVLSYEMPEPDAFFCLNAMLQKHIPRYVNRTIDGVHHSCQLVERILEECDPQLSAHLQSKCLTGQLYAFPYLLSLYSSVPPLTEVIKIWDVMFAFGVHLVALLVVAQCIMLRDELLNDTNPMKHLLPRNHPDLDAEIMIAAGLQLLPHISDELFIELAGHAFMSPELGDEEQKM
mmetsp:Transcript_21314/g.27964  ORF Transcript_21314/g.27964 Transcript_21314/m.27964 type:complete len:390 (+) Transcript_21314:48-1217(+)|eukprot:CAMPEP_0117792790 /NCGR_PEP_ID=MMETSP0948-20121206/9654_1 /TAXON_ID=44440 /ORGANISM="Chattonella subsalsa, Strain CCMP2191" /LENGTH=389 /DNA_ID=CAMNT_0005623085 /DNA_START=32 /DNA_END=1201 /DNA_ORIENTATION=-